MWRSVFKMFRSKFKFLFVSFPTDLSTSKHRKSGGWGKQIWRVQNSLGDRNLLQRPELAMPIHQDSMVNRRQIDDIHLLSQFKHQHWFRIKDCMSDTEIHTSYTHPNTHPNATTYQRISHKQINDAETEQKKPNNAVHNRKDPRHVGDHVWIVRHDWKCKSIPQWRDNYKHKFQSVWPYTSYTTPTTIRRNLKTQKSLIILDLCLMKTSTWLSYLFSKWFSAKTAFSNSSGL